MFKNRLSRVNRRARDGENLGLENLEPRMLLAGNVLASLTDGTLSIVGDSANNSVLVSTFNDATYGTGFRVEGIDNGGPTSINGGGSAAEFFGVTNLNVDLQDGDDELAITNDVDELLKCFEDVVEPPTETATFVEEVNVPGWAVIKMGAGDNRVGIGHATFGQRLLIQGGASHDEVGLCEVYVGANLVIQTFGGYDEVFIHESESAGATKILTANGNSEVEVDGLYARDLIVRGGNHEDDIGLFCLFIQDDVVIQTLNGFDRVLVGGCKFSDGEGVEPASSDPWIQKSEIGDMLLIQTVDGGAKIGVFAVNAGQVNILGGIHRDSVDVTMVYTKFNINVNTLDEQDYVSAAQVNALNMIVLTGIGDDSVFVGRFDSRESYFRDDLIIITSTGNDRVRIGDERRDEPSPELALERIANIQDDLVIDTGDDTDLIEIFYYDVGDDATIDAGAGDDSGCERHEEDLTVAQSSELIGGVRLHEMRVGSNLHVFLGSGDDSADIDDVYVGNNAFIDAGSGDDGDSKMVKGSEWCFGNRGVRIDSLNVGNNFWLYLGTGFDSADVDDLSVGNNAFFNAGADDDALSLYYVSAINNIYVFMGGGDDDLYVDKCKADSAWLYGDGGDGDFYSQGINDFGSQHVFTFEFAVA